MVIEKIYDDRGLIMKQCKKRHDDRRLIMMDDVGRMLRSHLHTFRRRFESLSIDVLC
jgi:hypothetical protein